MFPNDTRILVVDDMLTMRKLVKKGLTQIGFTNIVEAPDGDVAWKKVMDMVDMGAPVQLIISDWNMPNMKGIELLKKVRAEAKTKATPFCLLTAESEKSQVIEAVQAGVNEYIVKPFTKDQLEEKLKNVWAKVGSKAAA